MRNASRVGRIAALVALVAAGSLVAVLLLRAGNGSYTVKANFENASQLVNGNLVQVAGTKVGKVTGITLTPGGEAQLTLTIDGDYAPLRRGTVITVRQASLSGIANRYLDLRLPSGNPERIPEGAVIPSSQTTSAVDLDQVFDTFGPRERQALREVLRGSNTQYAGRGDQAQAGFRYLNPALASSSVLFRELNRDTPLLTRFIVSSAKLTHDVAQRRDDLAGLVDHLATTTRAVSHQRRALGSALDQLPPFMRRANSTFVDLRSTLDDLRPLVEDSKPVAKKLRPFLAQLRPLTRDARPALRDLANIIRRPGGGNDLIELTADSVPLAQVAVDRVQANGKLREGAFPATTRALGTSTPELAYARPYATDLTGWFDDFSHTGVYDALGAASRVQAGFNAFSLQQQTFVPLDPALRALNFDKLVTRGQYARCPGSLERDPGDHSTPYQPSPAYPCDASQVPPGK